MSIKTWFLNLFPIFKREGNSFEINNEYFRLTAEIYYKQLAIQAAINRIASSLSVAEWKVYQKGEIAKDEIYYMMNIEPNQNMNAAEFWRNIVHKIVYENEALIILQNKQLYLAESFTKEEKVFVSNKYKNLKVGNLILNKTYNEDEVLYLKLNSEKMRSLIDALYIDYGKLIEYSKNTYRRSNARRGVLNIPTSYPQTPKATEDLNKLLGENLKRFYEAEAGSVLPLTGGIKFEDLTNKTYKNGSDSRDIRALIDDVFDYVAIAFQIPPQMLKGTIADSDKTWNDYMTFCAKPLLEIFQDEINRKIFGKENFSKGTYLAIDTTRIRDFDIKEISSSIDILTRNGVNTLDDNLRMLGREPIGGDIGEMRLITLNLTKFEEKMKGGEKNGEEKD